MIKRTTSVLLCICIMLTMCFALSACGSISNDEFPVTIGNVTISEEPKNITVLSDCMSDIISFIGYDVKMVGRDVESDQDFLSIVPAVGSAENPNIDAIVANETDLVIADERLGADSKKRLEENNINVLTFAKATSFDELKSLFTTIGTALGGNTTGKEKGQSSYAELLQTLKEFKGTVPSSIVKTMCYLYVDENNDLCTFVKDSVESQLLSYCGAINIFANQTEAKIDIEQLKRNTPTYIFYDNEQVMIKLKSDPSIANMTALVKNNLYQINKKDFNRQGTTYEDIIYHMIDIMFVQPATADQATPNDATQPTAESTSATQPATVTSDTAQ